jgi:hypothetical protein
MDASQGLPPDAQLLVSAFSAARVDTFAAVEVAESKYRRTITIL